MTESDKNCSMHSAQMALVGEHVKQISDLYDKNDDMKELIAKIETTLATLTLTMEHGFKDANNKIQELSCDIKKMNVQREKTIAYYDVIVEDFKRQFSSIDKELAELNKFSWFRQKMNGVRDNFAFYTIIVILGAFTLLAALQTGIMNNLKRIFG